MKTIWNHAHLVSPGREIADGALIVENAVIVEVLEHSLETIPDGARAYDLDGALLWPGFVDIHCHGCMNCDFCDGTETAVRTLARGKLRQGVTTVLGTTLTLPEETLSRALEAIRDYMRAPDGAKVPAIHLEGPFFVPECAGAQNPDYLKLPDVKLVERLNAIYPVAKLSYSPELDRDLALVKALAQMHIMPAAAHTQATYDDLKHAMQYGLRHMSHFCNVMTPLHHLRFGLVGGGLLHDELLVEIITDGVHLCDEMIELIFKVKPLESVMLITDSMRAAGAGDGEAYTLGGLPVVVKDGCARLLTGQVAGSTLEFYQGLRRVRRLTGRPLAELAYVTGWNQARSLRLGRIGKLEPGFAADLVELDQDLTPRRTWVDGELRFNSDCA